jgi:hypothetical protein
MAGVMTAIVWVVVAIVVVGIAVTIALVVRDRPAQPVRRHPDPYRVRGRSIRGWQNSAIREIRRAGTQHGKRGRRGR